MAGYSVNNIVEWPRSLRFLVMLLVFALVFYGGYYFDLLALSHNVLSVKQQEENLKQQLEIVFAKKAALEDEISQLPALEHILTFWQQKLIKPKELPELLHQILKTGVSNDLQFVYFNPGAERVEGIYSTQPIKVVVVGNYHQIANFASQIANMPTIVVIKDFTIVRGDLDAMAGAGAAGPAGSHNHLSAEFSLEAYHIDQQ